MKTFKELPLREELQKAITEMGFEETTAIQAEALPILLNKETDFLGLAATGTGKTASFAIPLLQKIKKDQKGVQALILCPTRELALQVAGQIDMLGKYCGIRSVSIYGGAAYGGQLAGLKNGAQIVVGTPGRVLDHVERKTLKLDQLKTLILDEADEMISMGFKDDMEAILSGVSLDQCKTWLFSATMNPQVSRLTEKYLKSPARVQVNRTEVVPVGIEQIYYYSKEANKPEILCKLIDMAEDFYGLIFCQTKASVADLTRFLNTKGYKVDCLHGDMTQQARERTMLAFRNRTLKILVCTDVASRGLDVKDISHVVNYSLPRELESYVHRIGRTARSGKTGFAMSLVSPAHFHLVSKLERITKSKMKEGVVPTRKEIGAKVLSSHLEGFKGAQNEQSSRAMELLDASWKETLAGMTTEEVAARFLAMQFPSLFSGLDRAKEHQVAPLRVRDDHDNRGTRKGRPSSGGGGFRRRDDDRGPRGGDERRGDGRRPEGRRFEDRRSDDRRPDDSRGEDRRPGGRPAFRFKKQGGGTTGGARRSNAGDDTGGSSTTRRNRSGSETRRPSSGGFGSRPASRS